MSYKAYKGELTAATILFSTRTMVFSVDHAHYFRRTKSSVAFIKQRFI